MLVNPTNPGKKKQPLSSFAREDGKSFLEIEFEFKDSSKGFHIWFVLQIRVTL